MVLSDIFGVTCVRPVSSPIEIGQGKCHRTRQIPPDFRQELGRVLVGSQKHQKENTKSQRTWGVGGGNFVALPPIHTNRSTLGGVLHSPFKGTGSRMSGSMLAFNRGDK